MKDTQNIRNSTAEFLIFQLANREDGIEVLYREETLWLTQDAIATLFDKSRSTITEHLSNIFKSGELDENSVRRNFRRTAADGKNYTIKYYNLDAVISVGYRANSIRATQFRQWCTSVLRQYAIRGYVKLISFWMLMTGLFFRTVVPFHRLRLNCMRSVNSKNIG